VKLKGIVLSHEISRALKRLDKQMKKVMGATNRRQLDPEVRISRRIFEG
jgi:hypothetical protein